LDNFDVIVVGGGLAGLSAAYTLGKAGIGVLVVETRRLFRLKNVTGGRLYLNPVRKLLPISGNRRPWKGSLPKNAS